MSVKRTEYLPWPGPQEYPGPDTKPNLNYSAPDATLVHGRYGWEWEEDTSAAVQDVKAAVDAAKGIQRFLNISTDQLTVKSTAFINEAIIQKIWTRVITAEEGEFAKIKANMIEAHKVVADEVRAGAIDGMVITGATFQTGPPGTNPRILIDKQGMDVWDENGKHTFAVSKKGNVRVDGSVGISDSWSNCFFEDVKANGGQDIDGAGVKIGVGLLFNRNTGSDYRVPGAITIRERPDGTPSIQFFAPSWTTQTANMDLSSKKINIVAPMGGELDIDNAGVEVKYKGKLALLCTDDRVLLRGAKYESGQFGVRCSANESSLSWDWNCDVRMYTDNGGPGQVAQLTANNSKLTLQSNPDTDYVANVLGGGLYAWGRLAGTNKQFIIPHPLDPMNRALQHACTESPWPSVEYWDTVEIGSDGTAVVDLPEYFNALHRPDLPVGVFCQGPGSPYASEVRMGRFTVHGEPGSRVCWLVKAARRSETTLGNTYDDPPVEGPYMWNRAPGNEEGDPRNPIDLRWLYQPPVPTS
jgi:hypothetical protein|nr:MAG TPA: hypothetical protein [Caudoviricetes sp.]